MKASSESTKQHVLWDQDLVIDVIWVQRVWEWERVTRQIAIES